MKKRMPSKQAAKTARQKSVAKAIPEKIKIRREDGYRTHHIGKCSNGNQFMAFVVGAQPKGQPRAWPRTYAVLYLFDRDGNHLETQICCLGKGWREEFEEIDLLLDEMVAGLGRTTYCDIKIKLFSVEFDGQVFGLVDASESKENYVRVDLVPNDLGFFPPWNGYYDT